MDFRIQEDVNNWMKEQGILNNCDFIAVAGGVKDLVSPEKPEHRELLLKQVRISHDLHSMKRVILMNHTDCGAYGGRAAFSSDHEERERHVTDMKNTASLIKESWPDIEIKIILAVMEGDRIKEFEEIS
ncbi:hypothetical protein L6259_00860 [Candidatus Parcubacteria bacterium]|nr:hypothetical protein [Patescibacteria group bacterium]MCG2693823.1 hypothetical protein [Candidatus Parcubacteria bacterium]